MKSLNPIQLPSNPLADLDASPKQYVDTKEDAFSKGSLVQGNGIALTGTLSNRLVGSGNVTIAASLTASEAVLGSNYLITSTNVWEDTGLQITLPSAGVYLLFAPATGAINASTTQGGIYARLYNNSLGSAVSNSSTFLIGSMNTGQTLVGGHTIVNVVTVLGGNTIKLQGLRAAALGITYSTSSILAGGNNNTRLSYVRIG